MKKKIIITLSVIASVCGVAYAYTAGYCQVAGCKCHQYYGGPAPTDCCTVCGHHRAAHS